MERRPDAKRLETGRTRRQFASGALALGAVASLARPALAQARLEKELVFSSRGGSLGTVWRTKIIPNFEKTFDCKVTYVTSDSVPGLAKVVAEKAAPTVDVIWTTEQTHAQGKREGALDQLDFGRIPNAASCYDFATYPDKVGVMWGVGGCVMGYNSEILDRNKVPAPQSWTDLFAPALKGRVGWLDFSTAQGTSTFLMINRIKGGSETDVDPGFAFLKANLAQFAAIVSSPAQVDDVLQQRQAWVATNLDARFLLLKARKFPVRIAYGQEGIPQIGVILDLVKGARNPNLAHAFINHALSPEVQAIVGDEMQLGPTNRDAKVSTEVASDLIYGPERVSRLVRFDYDAVGRNIAGWIDRWNREIAR